MTFTPAQSGTGFAHPEAEAYPESLDLYSDELEIHPLNDPQEPKRRFIPSKWEMMKVQRIVRAIRAGRYKQEPRKSGKAPVYLLWGEDDAAIGADRRRSVALRQV
jgi:ribosome biogenesis protein ERB1